MFTGFCGVVAAAVVALGMTSGQREPGVVGKIQAEVAPSVTAPTPPKVDLGGLPPEAVAGWIAEEVAKFSWDAPRREAPDGENCEPYRPVLSVPYADEQWCQRCRREEGRASVETFFYSFDLAEPLACRLQQVRAHAKAINASEIHAALARRRRIGYRCG